MSEEELKQLQESRLCGLEKQLREYRQKSRYSFHMSFWCLLMSGLIAFLAFGLDKLMADKIIKTSCFLQGISDIAKVAIPILPVSIAMLITSIIEHIYFIWPVIDEINEIKKE